MRAVAVEVDIFLFYEFAEELLQIPTLQMVQLLVYEIDDQTVKIWFIDKDRFLSTAWIADIAFCYTSFFTMFFSLHQAQFT
ncbi:Uncharacterised protein [Haemophilus influenzae]|uniref:Uncharacterized protein n=1 Tax=Haemophilus influenzae TaxID=727 RepID=A0A2X1PIE2_HAEIF|nr:Uncharacterised protein [Haemophilus influenzae]